MNDERRRVRATNRRAPLALLLIAGLCLSACVTPSSNRPENLPAHINDVFLDEEMNVDGFVERFEGESRAVYAPVSYTHLTLPTKA